MNNKWYIGDGDITYSNGNTGQWGLKFASEIVKNHKIPVAIFNGARGAKSIRYFDKNYNEENQQFNNYQRLLYRLDKTDLKNEVKSCVLVSRRE